MDSKRRRTKIHRAAPPLFLLLLLILVLFCCGVTAKNISSSSSVANGVVWTTSSSSSSSQDENDLDAPTTASQQPDDQLEDLEGGFSSLDSMLQWAIGHSDPAKLRETADSVKRLSLDELKKRQFELKELMEKLKMPSEAELMKVAIADLNNSSLSVEDHLRALHELLVLVEPIDSANDLNKLGGLVAVIKELQSSESEVRAVAALVLGKASQNNPTVQYQILDLGALPRLMNMVPLSSGEEAVKAMYAVSAVVRNNEYGQQIFYAEAGRKMLQDLMSNSSVDIRLRRKSTSLVADLAETHYYGNSTEDRHPFLDDKLFLKAVVDLLATSDVDLQEKALAALRSLLLLSLDEVMVFKDFCNLEHALEKLKADLVHLMKEEDQVEFLSDVENLRREVEAVFTEKLKKITETRQLS